MIYVIVTEIIAYCFSSFTTVNNAFVYNIFMLVSFMFYFYWFLKAQSAKKIVIQIMMLLFLISYIYSAFQEQFFYGLLKFPFLIGTLITLVLVSFLFAEILTSEDVIVFRHSQKFWFATGLLIFNIGFLPILFFQNVLDSYSMYHGLIIMILNVLLYGCFIIGFSVKIKE